MKKTIRTTAATTGEEPINQSTIIQFSGIAGSRKSSSVYEELEAKGIICTRFIPTGRLQKGVSTW